MKFTIDNFKTRIIRPADYIFSSKDIGFLLTRTIPEADNIHKIVAGVDLEGLVFSLSIENSEDNIVELRFDQVQISKNSTSEIYKVTFNTDIKPLRSTNELHCGLTYWAADQLLKRITSDIFKQLAKIESFDIN